MNEKAKQLWESSWAPETHQTEYAKRRMESAGSAKLTPVSLDKENMCGVFSGKHGRYETRLDYCPCVDFHRSKLPCKHIYRLAMELGVIGGDKKTDEALIVVPKEEKIKLNDLVDIVESLSEEQQLFLLEMTRKHRRGTSRVKTPGKDISVGLLASGLVTTSAKAKDLIAVSPTVSIRDLHYYLCRKYGEECIELGEDMIAVPRLQTRLSEDAVTQQLIKRGYYDPDNIVFDGATPDDIMEDIGLVDD